MTVYNFASFYHEDLFVYERYANNAIDLTAKIRHCKIMGIVQFPVPNKLNFYWVDPKKPDIAQLDP